MLCSHSRRVGRVRRRQVDERQEEEDEAGQGLVEAEQQRGRCEESIGQDARQGMASRERTEASEGQSYVKYPKMVVTST